MTRVRYSTGRCGPFFLGVLISVRFVPDSCFAGRCPVRELGRFNVLARASPGGQTLTTRTSGKNFVGGIRVDWLLVTQACDLNACCRPPASAFFRGPPDLRVVSAARRLTRMYVPCVTY